MLAARHADENVCANTTTLTHFTAGCVAGVVRLPIAVPLPTNALRHLVLPLRMLATNPHMAFVSRPPSPMPPAGKRLFTCATLKNTQTFCLATALYVSMPSTAGAADAPHAAKLICPVLLCPAQCLSAHTVVMSIVSVSTARPALREILAGAVVMPRV